MRLPAPLAHHSRICRFWSHHFIAFQVFIDFDLFKATAPECIFPLTPSQKWALSLWLPFLVIVALYLIAFRKVRWALGSASLPKEWSTWGIDTRAEWLAKNTVMKPSGWAQMSAGEHEQWVELAVCRWCASYPKSWATISPESRASWLAEITGKKLPDGWANMSADEREQWMQETQAARVPGAVQARADKAMNLLNKIMTVLFMYLCWQTAMPFECR